MTTRAAQEMSKRELRERITMYNINKIADLLRRLDTAGPIEMDHIFRMLGEYPAEFVKSIKRSSQC